MGASSSYQKKDHIENELDSLESEVQNLQAYLNDKYNTPDGDVELIGTDELDNLFEKYLNKDLNKDLNDKQEKDIRTVQELKTSMELYLLYDNYNVKNSVIIKDLTKKYENQMKELKKQNEKNDLLSHNINILKNKITKNNNTNTALLVFIIIFVILIILLGVLIYLKYKN